MPKASVIVPTYGNRPDFLRETLHSVQGQEFPVDDFEILVVDNSPDSNAYRIVEEVNQQGRPPVLYFTEKNTGLHHARHAGAREARGEILVYIDDDVLVHCDWLTALLESFQDSRVACSGGKILLQYEAEQPEWLPQFRSGGHGFLDLGEKKLELKWPECVYGGNMAVRKKVLYDAGGFNPDGFADPRLIWLRGDGEIGLLKKIFDLGHKIVYEPRAWLYHRIPASKLTPKFFYKRCFAGGIYDSYVRIRNMRKRRRMTVPLMIHAARCFLLSAYRYTRSLLPLKDRIRIRADAFKWYGEGQHQLRTALSRRLREHVLRDSYL